MKRIFPAYTYSDVPRQGCWWDETIGAPTWLQADGDLRFDIAIIGGGFTGLSAALHLAEQGVSVAVFEAQTPGWGASGRNGGFCCLGGSKLSHKAMMRSYGEAETLAYEQAESDAVDLAADLIQRNGIDADVHSKGETRLAHSKHAFEKMQRDTDGDARLHKPSELAELGLGGNFFGGVTVSKGFALNPRKYLFGLARTAQDAGATLFQNSPVNKISDRINGFELVLDRARVFAEKVLVCTNGYSSEDLPTWFSGRYMPTQSSVMVTRPLTDVELEAQGWTSDQMAYDSRNLLHYFRLMPDRRFLFGMRGGLLSSPKSEALIHKKLRYDFDQMFPSWRSVESTHCWSGLVCLTRDLVPFCGEVPETPGLYAGLAYHGNGVAMGTYTGRALARLALGTDPKLPRPMSKPMRRFPLGQWRRLLMPPAYLALGLADIR